MDSKERVPDYRMKCTLDILYNAIKDLREDVMKAGITEIDFYYTNHELEKEFKNHMNDYLGISNKL